MSSKGASKLRRNRSIKRKILPLAIGLVFAGTAWGQATNGTIYGTVPVAPNESIQVTGGSGFNQTVAVGENGRYSITLPVGTYTVSLMQHGEVVQSRSGVTPAAAGAVVVNFTSSGNAANAVDLSTVSVSANSIPPIDVTTTNQVTTVTARELRQLPLGRTAADIAMLAPGVNMGSPQLNAGPLGEGVNVFGGASTAENAYYIDGMNVTSALNAQGGLSLPYGAIQQQQTFISGYGAKYGRSIGGVINQIGKSGTNEWHFGVRAQFDPSSWAADKRNYYYQNTLSKLEGQRPGDIQHYYKANHGQSRVYDAYVSGPLIRDRLFFLLAAEKNESQGKNVGNVYDPHAYNYKVQRPKIYAKINWNINNRNILTLTGLQTSRKEWDSIYDFDYDTF
ncbi:MAG TPA: TonB-dependent receptor plug domain-containing protein, partial [Oleiagrimonas sp.]|nr:TonB-dependent receptor plug domain-containing protein [Oleiagrimonas sp.]